jgi:ADP-L-glycero-D-manno-heptose 6-epimerase
MSQGLIYVTGGAGFIGSNIVGRLAGRPDCEVVVCDTFGDAQDGKWRNLANHRVTRFVAPADQDRFLEDHWRAILAVIHMGAISATTERDVDSIVATNITLSQRLWEWCAHRQCPLIYASSAATYGDGTQGFVDDNAIEAVRGLRPLNAYGWSKKVFDEYALDRAACGVAPPIWAGLRFFNVYGPNEYHKGAQRSVVATIHPQIMAEGQVRLFRSHRPDFADGGQLRDFIHVRDCVDVVEWLLESGTHGGIVNVGTGAARSFRDLAEATFTALGRPPRIEFVDTPEAIRDKYQYFTQADLTRLRTLGFPGQFTPLEDGVADYVRNYLERENAYA